MVNDDYQEGSVHDFLNSGLHAIAMDRNRPSDARKPDAQRCEALFHLADGTVFEFRMSTGCERFVGRFTRLPELRHANHIIRFRDLVFTDRSRD
jgi:hypothetical protein